VDSSCLRNLADPEVRRGYVYLPIQGKHLRDLWIRDSKTHGRAEKWFLGKPIQSNVQHVLSSVERVSAIAAKGFEIEAKSYARSESGLIWVVDLSGYGATLKHVGATMHSFRESGSQAQDFFRQEVTEQFQIMLGELDVTQAQIAGDGFVAAFPDRVFPSIIETRDRIVSRWCEFLAYIQILNKSIREPDRKVGSRMVLHIGSYRFGRIGGPRSFSPAFDGGPIIQAVRLDQGLSAAIKSLSDCPSGASNHFLAVSEELNTLTDGHELSSNWKSLGMVNLSAKEFQGQSKLYRLA
jgi:hypothetical protein